MKLEAQPEDPSQKMLWKLGDVALKSGSKPHSVTAYIPPEGSFIQSEKAGEKNHAVTYVMDININTKANRDTAMADLKDIVRHLSNLKLLNGNVREADIQPEAAAQIIAKGASLKKNFAVYESNGNLKLRVFFADNNPKQLAGETQQDALAEMLNVAIRQAQNENQARNAGKPQIA